MRIAQMILGIKSNFALYQTFILDIATRMDQSMENPIHSCLEHGEVLTVLKGTCGSGTVNVVGKRLSNPFSINQILYFFVQIFKQEFFFKNRFFSLASCTI